MIIGICGKSCSGKTTLAKEIIERTNKNSVYLNIDKVGHNALMINDVKEKLVECFGNSIMMEGNVDRKKLRELVFASRNEMQKLTDITWKPMEIEIDEFLRENKDKIVILDWLLLTNTKYFGMCDLKILLDVPYEIRKERAVKRDNISDRDFDLREQASIDFKEEDFDYVFTNNEHDLERMLVKLG